MSDSDNDIGTEPLDIDELVSALAKDGIVIPPEEAAQIKTVADAIAWFERYHGWQP